MKKRIVLFVCIILLFSACTSTQNYATATHEIDLFVEKFTSNDVNPRSYIRVEIDGKKYNAMFDTGDYSGGITLPVQEIENLGLKQTESRTAMRATSAPVEVNLYNVPQMCIGDNVVLYDVVCGTEPSEDGIGQDVIIGMQPFKDKYNILISYKQKKIYLWDKNYTPDFLFEWTAVPLAEPNDLLINGTIDGAVYTFILDTGSPAYFDKNLYNISFEEFESAINKTIVLGDSEFISDFWYIENPYKDMMPFDIALGTLFYDYDIFIDFASGMVYIEN